MKEIEKLNNDKEGLLKRVTDLEEINSGLRENLRVAK